MLTNALSAGVIEVIADGVPAGWGDPVFAKLDATLAAGLMSIGAVKGVEIGAGFSAAGGHAIARRGGAPCETAVCCSKAQGAGIEPGLAAD